jgi:predicted DNA-binding transcriptional regulator YafY
MRVERIQHLQQLLRGREATTVAALAQELSVSVRTIRRDLAALRDMGVAVHADPGPGGGVRIERSASGASVSFNGDEVVALWLSAHLSRVASNVPWSAAARSALDKLFGSLSRERARELRAVCRRVIVGGAATDRVRATAGQAPPELLAYFELAFRKRVALSFGYRDRHGAETWRRVEPHGLLVEPPVWYVLARDIDKGEPRSFRMDRIERPRLVESHSFVADDRVVRALTEHVAPRS